MTATARPAKADESMHHRLRTLRFLASGAARVAPGGEPVTLRLLRGNSSAEKSMTVAATLLVGLERDDLVSCQGDAVALSPAGRAWLKRIMSAGEGPFRAQHGNVVAKALDVGDDKGRKVLIDEAESPLAWLYRRRGRDGARLIDDAQFNAGERLRADYTKGRMAPRITANWSANINQGRRRSGEAGGVVDLTDAALAARQRVRRALEATGPELSGVLVDVCCFLKGLEAVETERRWPARSAKIILSLALERLARHYGYTVPPRDRAPLLHWGADDFRPDLSAGDG